MFFYLCFMFLFIRYCNFRIRILYGIRWWWLSKRLIKFCFGWCWRLLWYYCGKFCIWFRNKMWLLCIVCGRFWIKYKGFLRRFRICRIIWWRRWRWRWRRLCWRKRRMRWWWRWRWRGRCVRCGCVMCVWYGRWFRKIYKWGRCLLMCFKCWFRIVRWG